MICSDRLHVAEFATASKSLENGSYDFLDIQGKIPEDRHQLTLMLICEYLNVDVSEATGELCACEANRKRCCYNLFYYGQNLLHIFKLPNNTGYVVKYKSLIPQSGLIFIL